MMSDESIEMAADETKSLPSLFRPTTVGELLCRIMGPSHFVEMMTKGGIDQETRNRVESIADREKIYLAVKRKIG